MQPATNKQASKGNDMKKLVTEFGKGVVGTMGAALGALLLSLCSKAIRSTLGIPLTDATMSVIRFWLFISGIGLILSIGWLRFFRERRKLRLAQRDLDQAQTKPRRFQDDFDFDSRLGVYLPKAGLGRSGYFCGSCTQKGVESPLKVEEAGWRCLIEDCEKWHDNPDFKPPPKSPPKRSPWRLDPEDF